MAVLSAVKQGNLVSEYDNWIKVALRGRPAALTVKDLQGKTPDERNAALQARGEKIAAYDANPGAKILGDTQTEVASLGYPIDRNTGKFVGPEADIANDEVKRRLITKRTAYIGGLEEGAKDQSHLNNAMQQLWSFNIPGAIKELFLAIPLVGDIMAAGGKMLMSLFSGKPIGPMAAFEDIKAERALAGGFEKLGIKDKAMVDAFSKAAISRTVAEPKEESSASTSSTSGTEPSKAEAMAKYRESVEAYAKANPLIIDEAAFVERVMGSERVKTDLGNMDASAIIAAAQKNTEKAQKFTQITGNAEEVGKDRAQLRDDIKNGKDETELNGSREKLSNDFKTMAEKAKLDPELMKLNIGGKSTVDIESLDNTGKILVLPARVVAPTGRE